jgi:hypothetical protein
MMLRSAHSATGQSLYPVSELFGEVCGLQKGV